METISFLQSVLSSNGQYCTLSLKGKRRIQNFHSSIEDAIKEATEKDAEGYDTFFAVATFKDSSSRKSENALEIKSFFLDLDCGSGKEYASQREAIAGVKHLCKKFNLPHPLLVNSGRGVHVYWPLKEAVTAGEWVSVANKFKKGCADTIPIDPAVPADRSRVLRIPATHNYKDTPPKEVTFLSSEIPEPVDFDTFAELFGADPIPVPAIKHVSGGNAMLDTLMGNRDTYFKEILIKISAGRGCAQLAHIINNQDSISEPLWRSGLSIAKFCVDGEKAMHVMSNKHPEYSFSKTIQKVAHIAGPHHCARFDENNPDVCKQCSHYGKITSPIVLGGKIREATEEDNLVAAPAVDSFTEAPKERVYEIPVYPKPYFRGAKGGIYLRTRTAEGDIDEKHLYHNDLYAVGRIKDLDLGECAILRLHMPQDGVSEFIIPLTAITSRDEFRRTLSAEGVCVTRMEPIMEYVATWVNTLQADSAAPRAHRQFGWTADEEAFVVGNKEITPLGTQKNYASGATAGFFPFFQKRGTLAGWKEAMSFYNTYGQELYQIIVCAGMGSVLTNFLPNISAASMHIYGKGSGEGKSTALHAAMTAWGDPHKLTIDAQSTKNFTMNRSEVYKNIFLGIDELTNAKGDELSDLIYQLTGGEQRGRLQGSVNRERVRGDRWSFLACSTGNTSFLERVAAFKSMPKAEAQRVLEVHVSRLKDKVPKRITDEFNHKLYDNYGHAAEIFIQYVVSNKDSVKDLLFKVQRKMDKALGFSQENRFWSAYVTCTVTTAILAKRLKLLPYDVDNIVKYWGRIIEMNKDGVGRISENVQEILNNYIHAHAGSILKIKSTSDARLAADAVATLAPIDNEPRVRLVARYETDTKDLALLLKPLKEWCTSQQVNYTAFVNDLIEEMGAKRVKRRIGKGTTMDLPATNVILVNCAALSSTDIREATDSEEGSSGA